MKTRLFRVWALGATISSLALGTGCEQKMANGEVPPITTAAPAAVGAADEPPVLARETNLVENPAAPATATNVVDKSPAVKGSSENVSLSPALNNLVKMVQSGVSEDVILSYVTNTPGSFGVGTEQIIYLHDLGVSSTVTKALIQHDAAAGTKAASAGVSENTAIASTTLPPSYEQTQPVTNTAPAVTVAATPAQTPVSVNYFYSYLSPYGRWIEVEGYGLCWQPTVAISNPGWRPYSDEGYWLWTDNGWYWYSYYSWGWAPFHYGRWCHRPRLGWFWLPDTHWGPAWVSWREGGEYCGWAPLPPEVVYMPGAGLYYHGAAISVGFDFGLTDFHYTFLDRRHFCERRPHPYFLPRHRAEPIFHQSLVANHYQLDNRHQIINRGVGFDRINAVAPGRVPRAAIREAPLGPPAGARPEHLEVRPGAVVIHRPVLPKEPPPSPRITPARLTATEPGATPPPSLRPGGLRERPSGPRPGREPIMSTPLPPRIGPPAALSTGPEPRVGPSTPPSSEAARAPQNNGPSGGRTLPGASAPGRSAPGGSAPVGSAPGGITPSGSAPGGSPPGGRSLSGPSENRLATMATRSSSTPPGSGSQNSRQAPQSGRTQGPSSSFNPLSSGSSTPSSRPDTGGSGRTGSFNPPSSPPSSSRSAERPSLSPGSGSSTRSTPSMPPVAPQRMESRAPSSGPPSGTRPSAGPSGSAPSSRSVSGSTAPPSYSSPPASRPSSSPSGPPPSVSAPSRAPSGPPPGQSYSSPPPSRSQPSSPPPSGGGRPPPGGKGDDKKK